MAVMIPAQQLDQEDDVMTTSMSLDQEDYDTFVSYSELKEDDDQLMEVVSDAEDGVFVKRPYQCMEIVPFERPYQCREIVPVAEVMTTVENQPVNYPTKSSIFRWKIEKYSRLFTRKEHSDVFTAGGYNWRVTMCHVRHCLSMYLEVADWAANLPFGWSINAQFSLAIVNQIDSKYTLRSSAQHQFTAQERVRGYPMFMYLEVLQNTDNGFIVNNTCMVEIEVDVKSKTIDYWKPYDSKNETGYVGLTNQGATCYMNSLLQTLYHIPYFRRAVYHMPTAETENDATSEDIPLAEQKKGSIPLALQTLFYKLQYSEYSVSTKDLTKSFGWDTLDSFRQHDVQELNRILCENLENKMKGTVVEGTIQKLFEGHNMNYIECINVDYKSTRKESFYDLQLDVKGCRDVYASFDKYVEVERLEGDNKYHADEQHGLQDARKGVLFMDFPPVLQLQLKRYEYDFTRDAMVKINDRYEYPLQLDLDREDGKYLSADSDRSVRNLYTLHGVLVHSGGGHGGHYYAFIRPTLSEQWFKFNDERVTKEDIEKALEEQYGGETKYSSAYMLVYIRESDRDEIMCSVDEKDIAEHLRTRLKKEQEEKEHKMKEEAEAHLYTIVKVARDEDLSEQIGRHIHFNLVDHNKVHSFRTQKQMPFNFFKEEVAKEFGVPVQFQRFWLWSEGNRPDRPLMIPEEMTLTVEKLREAQYRECYNLADNMELKLFLEIELGPELHPIPLPDRTRDDILLFFKLYDAEKEEIRYVGRLFVKNSGKPLEILTKLNEMARFSTDEEVELYVEQIGTCCPIDKNLKFEDSQLRDGGIICFQKSASADSMIVHRYPDLPSFLEYIHNRQVVHFRSLEKPKEDGFCLELSKILTYDGVTEGVASHLGLDDPTKIRLTRHNCYQHKPCSLAIEYQGVRNLSGMLTGTSDVLYYEVLDISLPEMQDLKTLEVGFYHENNMVVHSITLPKQCTVGDLINDLKTKVELSHPDAEIRLLEICYHKIWKIFPVSDEIERLNDKYCWSLRAEEIPEEEKNLGPQDRLVHVYHFTNTSFVEKFGEPFFLIVHEAETLGEIKLRIQKKLQIPDEEFVKWKFAFFKHGPPEYLQDSDIVSNLFHDSDNYASFNQPFLGLEHSDSSPKPASAAYQNRHTESAVKIYN